MNAGDFAVSEARDQFLDLLETEQVTLESLSPRRAFELMIEFFTLWSPLDVAIDDDGDGLLFQWGTYDWGHTGAPHFEVDLTRQLIVPDREEEDDEESDPEDFDPDAEDEGVYQLSLTFQFDSTDETAALETGNAWFFAPAIDSDPETGVLSSDVLAAVDGMPVMSVTLEFSAV